MHAFLQCKVLTDPRTNDTYELLDYIGEGTFSVVQRARLLRRGEENVIVDTSAAGGKETSLVAFQQLHELVSNHYY